MVDSQIHKMFRVITLPELRTKVHDQYYIITTDHYKALITGQYLLLKYSDMGYVKVCQSVPCAHLPAFHNDLEGVHIVTSTILFDMNPTLPMITNTSEPIDMPLFESQLRSLSKSALKELLSQSPAFQEAVSNNDAYRVICDYYKHCVAGNKESAHTLMTDLEKFIQSGKAGADSKTKFYGNYI